MTENAEQLFGQEHVKRYRETGGEVGHDWQRGAPTLLLTTKGRRSGKQRTTPLIYQPWGDAYLLIASQGGLSEHPAWYLNIQEEPNVEIQVWDDRFRARARTAKPDERPPMWRQMAEVWPDYNDYQERTDREIPVVVLERE
jgi:deazaflavin-dependent oxidoreductase (nitroreductase family)